MGIHQIILPDFVIIGANKAGTTSIANYLDQNPQIQLSNPKEPMYFSSSPYFAKSVAIENSKLSQNYYASSLLEYSSLLLPINKDVKLFFEASTSYLANPNMSSYMLKKIVPDVKLIAILREPAERAISAYKMCVGSGIETRSFSEIVHNAANELKMIDNHSVKEYIRNGLYFQLLKPYFSLFDKEQILLLDYNNLKSNPRDFMLKIYSFLNLEPFDLEEHKTLNRSEHHLQNKELHISKEHINRLKDLYTDELNLLYQHYGFKFENITPE